jgi:hypothetical protein
MRAKPNPGADTSLLCSEPGCTNPWSSNYGRRWCSAHNPGLSGYKPVQTQSTLVGLPTLRDAVRPFSEPTEPDEEYVHGE